MIENSHLAEQTLEDRVSSLSALVKWIDSEHETARGIRVIRAIATHDLAALEKREAPKPCDPSTICAFLQDDGPLPDQDAGSVVRNSKPKESLDRRRGKLEAAFRKWGIRWTPQLVRTEGGGRGNASLFRLEFAPLQELEVEPDGADALTEGELRYEVRPAKVMWPLRWLFVPGGFELSWRTWRGFVFLSSVSLAFVLAGGMGLLAWYSLRSTQPNLAAMVVFLILAGLLWQVSKTFFEAAMKRTVECPTLLLAVDELFGQIRVIRQRPRNSWLAVVRITAQCPHCFGDVELMKGDPQFVGRMVGRCTDAPTEHLFSFDPTTNRGRPLN